MSPLAAAFEPESFLRTVIVQLIVIIVAARAGGWLFARLGQPQVVGEIAAGLLLGPSCCGRLAPDLHRVVFPDAARPVFEAFGHLGLVLLMFQVGLEFEFGHLRRLGRLAAGVAVAGIAAPFALGLALAWLLHPHVAPDLNLTGFMLFMATALSITAIPILGRILLEFDLHRTRLGVITIAAAAVDDAGGWILLAAVSALVAGGFELGAVARTAGLTLGLVVLSVFLLRPLMVAWIRRTLVAKRGELGLVPFSVVLVAVLAAAALTSWIGIFSIFGPFLLGAVLWDQHELRAAIGPRTRDFVTVFFLPVFFTYTGLKTDLRLLDSGVLWLYCLLVTLVACAGKMLGCGLAARVGGLSWRDSASIAVLMNTRALMGLIAIDIGRSLGVIPDSVFSMLVIMALATTFLTSPLLRRLMRSGPRESAESG